MMRWLVLLAVPGLMAQTGIRVQFSPEQMPSGLAVRGLYPWSVRVCSDLPVKRRVEPERVYMAAGSIPVKSPARVRLAFAATPRRTAKAIIAEWATEGVVIASGLTGFGAISASTKVVGSLAIGVYLGGRVARKLSEVPDYGPFLADLLESPIDLDPGGCATRTVFSGPMQRSDIGKVDATIQ